jgi:uncharacterized protein (TIGR00106 family)
LIIAEVSLVPIGVGTSVSSYVKRAVKAIEASGLKNQTGGMSTVIESPDLDTLFDVVKSAEAAILDAGAQRVAITIKIDDRKDKEATIEAKIKAATT